MPLEVAKTGAAKIGDIRLVDSVVDADHEGLFKSFSDGERDKLIKCGHWFGNSEPQFCPSVD